MDLRLLPPQQFLPKIFQGADFAAQMATVNSLREGETEGNNG
jgi:hypothetical protein